MRQFSLFRYFVLIYACGALPETARLHQPGSSTMPATAQGEEQKGIFDFLFGDFFSDCNCRCGVPNRDARLLGGEYVRTYEFPWLALLQIRDRMAVTATLINDRYIMTSASKVIGLTPFDVKVTLGQFDRCVPDVISQNTSVSAIIIHPDFSPGNRANDLALIRLSSTAIFGKRVRPICLSIPGQNFVGQVATLVGWAGGPQSDGGVSSTCRPRKVGLPILGYDECVANVFDPTYTSSDKGCVGVVGSNSVVCEADGGSAVMWKSIGGSYDLIGTLSDQNYCNDVPSLALYTKINPHLEWIKKHTRDACYCTKLPFFH